MEIVKKFCRCAAYDAFLFFCSASEPSWRDPWQQSPEYGQLQVLPLPLALTTSHARRGPASSQKVPQPRLPSRTRPSWKTQVRKIWIDLEFVRWDKVRWSFITSVLHQENSGTKMASVKRKPSIINKPRYSKDIINKTNRKTNKNSNKIQPDLMVAFTLLHIWNTYTYFDIQTTFQKPNSATWCVWFSFATSQLSVSYSICYRLLLVINRIYHGCKMVFIYSYINPRHQWKLNPVETAVATHLEK